MSNSEEKIIEDAIRKNAAVSDSGDTGGEHANGIVFRDPVPFGNIEQIMFGVNGDQFPFLEEVICHSAEVIRGEPEDIRLAFLADMGITGGEQSPFHGDPIGVSDHGGRFRR